jgi:alpha/beta superfamily hydrolase
MATREHDVRFLSPSSPPVELAGRLHLPASLAGVVPGVVLLHPQPLVADMEDPLTARLARDLAASGMAALRFNFRGVPPSGGEISDGRMEPRDVWRSDTSVPHPAPASAR